MQRLLEIATKFRSSAIYTLQTSCFAPFSPLVPRIQSYRKHPETASHDSRGRSVSVTRNTTVSSAYYKLKSVLDESKVRTLVKYQERFERRHDRRRRKLQETHWRKYMNYVKGEVKQAWSLKKR